MKERPIPFSCAMVRPPRRGNQDKRPPYRLALHIRLDITLPAPHTVLIICPHTGTAASTFGVAGVATTMAVITVATATATGMAMEAATGKGDRGDGGDGGHGGGHGH
jgi:hypothetical protein